MHWLFYHHIDNYVTGFDFDSSGERIAAIDRYGTFLVSDVSTNNYNFSLNMKMKNYSGKFDIKST